MPKVATWGNFFWPYWIIVTSVTFLGPEIYALITNFRNTLSDYARYELGVTVGVNNHGIHSIAWWASLLVWLVFIAWITPHIWIVQYRWPR